MTTLKSSLPTAVQLANLDATCLTLSQEVRDLFSAANNVKFAADNLKALCMQPEVATYVQSLGMAGNPAFEQFVTTATQTQEQIETYLLPAINLYEALQKLNLASEKS